MTTLPAEIEYGFVVGRFLIAQGDGIDADTKPDAIAAEGTVTHKPVATVATATASPATILKAPITCTIAADGDGWMRDSQGAAGVWLVVGQYDVTFTFKTASLTGFRIEVTTAHTQAAPLDLTLAAPLIPGPATVFVVNEQVYADTLAAKAQVEALVDGLGNPVLAVNGVEADPATGAVTIPTGPTSWAQIEALPDTPVLVVDTDGRLTNQRTPTDGSVTAAKMASGLVAMTSAERTKLTSLPTDAQSATQVDTRSDARIAAWVGAAPAALDTLDELAAALGDNASFAASMTTLLAAKAPLASPTFTGTVTVPDAAFTQAKVSGLMAALASRIPTIYALTATTWPDRTAWIAANAPGYTGPVEWDGLAFATVVDPPSAIDIDRLTDREPA